MAKGDLIKIVNLILILTFTIFYIGLTTIIEFTNLQKIIIFGGLLFVYIFLSILLYRLNQRKLRRIPSREVEKIIVKEIPVKEEKLKTTNTTTKKYIGSISTKKYHLKTCRFAKLIKTKHTLKEDRRTKYNKLKFKPCKTCKPDKN